MEVVADWPEDVVAAVADQDADEAVETGVLEAEVEVEAELELFAAAVAVAALNAMFVPRR